MTYSDEKQPEEQKEQSTNLDNFNQDKLNKVDKEQESKSIASEEQVTKSFDSEITQLIDLKPISSVEDNSIDFTTSSVDKTEIENRSEVTNLQQQEQNLQEEIAALKETRALLQKEVTAQTKAIGRLVPEALAQLEQRKQVLQVEVEKLERRKERIQKEMRTTFAGTSQDLAIRIQGFKDYLVGSLQDLAVAAEQLELVPEEQPQAPPKSIATQPGGNNGNPKFAEMGFEEQAREIRQILDEYRNMPDYYGPPWRLRRTFEPIHAERVANWFFSQGGRGALRTMGSRLQNILVTSAVISVLRDLYDTRVSTLVLANSPEHLGEWRRGLQDCLGIDRRDFSPERGVALFEDAEVLAQKADRLVRQGKLPIIVIDDTEDKISLSMLQFPLWLAFAPDPKSSISADRF
ncbi:MAG: DUF3086 domain-containing protein [Trichodesmium sp.]